MSWAITMMGSGKASFSRRSTICFPASAMSSRRRPTYVSMVGASAPIWRALKAGGDHPPQAPMIVAVGREHVFHGHPQGQRPGRSDRGEVGPVGAGVRGDVLAHQEPSEEAGVGHGPGTHAEEVDDRGRATGVQGPVFGVRVRAGGIQYEYGVVGLHEHPLEERWSEGAQEGFPGRGRRDRAAGA
jgi:hypothetical protein